jgi:hypothetical protein
LNEQQCTSYRDDHEDGSLGQFQYARKVSPLPEIDPGHFETVPGKSCADEDPDQTADDAEEGSCFEPHPQEDEIDCHMSFLF